MHKIELKLAHSDARGTIIDLLKDKFDASTLITFENKAIRGNHVHAETTQWTYVIEGSIEAYSKDFEGVLLNEIFHKGDMFVSLPGEPHAMQALGKATVIVFTKGPRSGEDYSKDTEYFKLI